MKQLLIDESLIWDDGYTTGKQITELNSGLIYWDGFTEGLRQGKLEAEIEYQEKKVTADKR